MGRKSEWPKGTKITRTALGLPTKLLQAARLRAFKQGRTFQELVAEALADYLRKAKKGGDRR